MKWRDFIYDVYSKRPLGDGMESKAVFQPPASIQEITDLESQLGTMLPSDLRSLLLETNGVMSMLKIDNGDWFEDMWLLWPTHQILGENCTLRRESEAGVYEGPFRDLIFFANAGSDGILFGHPVEHGIVSQNVVAWLPMEVEMQTIAPTLRHFIEGWLMGTIFV